MLALLGAELVLTPAAEGMTRRDRARRGTRARDQECRHPAAIPEPGQSGNPSPHHRGGNLERHRWRRRCLRRRRRHRRHHHRRRPGAQAAQARGARSSRSSPRTARVLSQAARPARTRSRASAPVSCPEILDRSVIDEVLTVEQPGGVRHRAGARPLRGHPRRHLVRRSGRRGAARRRAAGDGRQDDRGGAARFRRALPVDGVVRGALTVHGRKANPSMHVDRAQLRFVRASFFLPRAQIGSGPMTMFYP